MLSRVSRALPLFFIAFALTAEDLTSDLIARRARLIDQLDGDTIVLVHGAAAPNYSLDINYEYRQESNFYYLTGIELADAALVLVPGATARRELLFLPQRDAQREHWNGKLPSFEEAAKHSGVETVLEIAELEPFLEQLASGRPYRSQANRYQPLTHDFDPFLGEVTRGRARLGVVLAKFPTLEEPPEPTLELANRIRERFAGISLRDVTLLVHEQRQTKSTYEMERLRRSAEISSEAHRAGMRVARPGANEYNVTAAIEQVYRDRGAMGWGYPSIAGSGPNATILHYSGGRRRMDAGDLLLVDAAANYEYYTVDITRTYPVSGKFSEPQKDIYRLVLAAQDAARNVVAPGKTVYEVRQKTVEVIKAGLLRLGLITDAEGEEYRTWYTHGAVHYLGMDVHDVGDTRKPLAAGQAFVIEPGIYIREEALESLPKTDQNLAFIESVWPAFEKYRGIGVRIEDSFLLTDRGLEDLSGSVPRTIEEIESFLAKR